jgi:hypothetical protein
VVLQILQIKLCGDRESFLLCQVHFPGPPFQAAFQFSSGPKGELKLKRKIAPAIRRNKKEDSNGRWKMLHLRFALFPKLGTERIFPRAAILAGMYCLNENLW